MKKQPEGHITKVHIIFDQIDATLQQMIERDQVLLSILTGKQNGTKGLLEIVEALPSQTRTRSKSPLIDAAKTLIGI